MDLMQAVEEYLATPNKVTRATLSMVYTQTKENQGLRKCGQLYGTEPCFRLEGHTGSHITLLQDGRYSWGPC